MKAAAIAALGLLIVLPAHAEQRHRASNLPTPTCDNDGRCTTFNAAAANINSKQDTGKNTHPPPAVSPPTKRATTAPLVTTPKEQESKARNTTPAIRNDPEVTTTEATVVTAAPTSAPDKTTDV